MNFSDQWKLGRDSLSAHFRSLLGGSIKIQLPLAMDALFKSALVTYVLT